MPPSTRTPIAVFAYRRPEHLARCLAALARCPRLEDCEVTIFCDGPRAGDAPEEITAVRSVAHEWATRHRARVQEADANRGLARSIVQGVSHLCGESGRVIVLEDDLEVAPDFLPYMLAGLDRYADEPAVFQVGGSRFPYPWPCREDACFIPAVTTWGWGTWRRAWEHFRWEPDGLSSLDDPAVARAFDLGDSYPYTRMLRHRLSGQNDSWGILWWWATFRAGGLTLYPRESLVTVGGFDGTGTHCEGTTSFLGAQAEGRFPIGPARFPESPTTHTAAYAAMQSWLRARTQPWWRRAWLSLYPA